MCTSFRAPLSKNPLLLAAIVVLASAISLSAHMIERRRPGVAAFVSSPTGDTDANPAPLAVDVPATDYRYGAESRLLLRGKLFVTDPADPDWPRITSVGFEAAGGPSGLPCSSH